ncbi:hypothetical protein HRI_000878400 [Hibiscus trionum]|uniref:Endonuclease/exonuclease/phosphatase domain-containing protein n=1 Tax=Hibiscus trionum TaxID=183268 RepID=A0A9W7H777_HIBTR|nr:hypothetical protein HRI_000878400 [Hibiscus trionum]
MSCSIVTWNVMGLGRPEKVRAVVNSLRKCKASIILLQETKLAAVKLGVLKRFKRSANWNVKVALASGTAGGLISCWDSKVFSLQKKFINSRWMGLFGVFVSNKCNCGILNLYAPNEARDRCSFLNEVSECISAMNVPVIIGGDFNVVLNAEERYGGVVSPESSAVFREFINKNNLIDLPLSGGKFTWFRGGNSVEASRLDRFLISPEILLNFPNLIQCTLPRSLSDHRPVLINEATKEDGKRPFKLFNSWLSDKKLGEKITDTIGCMANKGIGKSLRTVKSVIKS